MKNVLRSTFGTLMMAAFLAVVPPTYARGGHGGGHGGHGGHAGGQAARGHAAVGHVRGGHAGFRARSGGGHQFARAARGQGRYAARAYNWNGGRRWGGGYWGGGNYWYPSSGYSLGYYGLWLSILRNWLLRLSLRWVLMVRTTDTILTATDTGRP